MSNPKVLMDYIEVTLGQTTALQPKSGADGFRQIVTLIRSTETDVLEHLYADASESLARMSQTMFAKRSLHLWFFSHPTFDIFKSFLFDDDLVDAFIGYVSAIPRCRKRKNQIKKPKLRAEMHRAQTVLLFVEPYLELVRSSLKSHHLGLGPIDKKLPRNTVPLVSISPPNEDDVRQAHIRFFAAHMREEKEAFERTVIGKRVANLTSFLTSNELIETEVERKLDELYAQFGEPPTRIQGTYVNKVDQRIRQRTHEAMVCGSWVRFKAVSKKRYALVNDIEDDDVKSIDKVAFNIVGRLAQSAVKEWAESKRGCIPVGLKVHALKSMRKNAFGKGMDSWFRLEAATQTVLLPPVANPESAIDLLGILEKRLGEPIIDNESYQIQVCSQSRLTPERAAHLGIAFYLASDRIRSYDERATKTSHHNQTGKCIVIYGAGVCDKNFDWCGTDDRGEMTIGPPPDAIHCRTDVLWCHSQRDIYNVNLIATMLVHDQFDGYWKPLGDMFQIAMRDILERHQLLSVLEAPWVKNGWKEDDEEDGQFADAFKELSAYALDEVSRLEGANTPRSGILAEVNDLLQYCQDTVKGGSQW